ncbi:MAG TPA: L,D-transpeptidase [Jatrophihabitans sp.]|nr:L,D-transpeptidase [Jatrophihabitans sp.]
MLQRYGWRAYAIPVLAVVSVAALWHSTSAGSQPRSEPGSASLAAPTRKAPTPARGVPEPPALPSAPASAPYPAASLQLGDDAITCAHNGHPSLVVVSISKQHVWMCQGARQVYDSPATTGETDNGNATPTGSWTIQSRETNRYLVGPGYRDYVHYWLPFFGDFGFHDATWQRMPFGSPGYRTAGSHGCVHLPMTAVRWLYQWAQVGATIVTVQA